MSGRGGDSSRESHLVRRSFSHKFNLASDVFSISTEGGGVGVPAVIGRAMNSMCLTTVLHEHGTLSERRWPFFGGQAGVPRLKEQHTSVH